VAVSSGNSLNNTTQEQRALVVAMELLRAAIGDATIATAANTKRTEEDMARQARAVGDFADGKAASFADMGPRTGSADVGERGGRGGSSGAGQVLATVGAVGQVLGAVAGKFGAVVGTLGILAAAVAAPVSGLQVFGQAVKTIGTALAPILLPISTLMSTAALAFSEIITGALAPVMEEWFELILTNGISAIEFLIDVVQGLTQALQDLWDSVPEADDQQSADVAANFRDGLRAFGLPEEVVGKIAPTIGAETRVAGGGAAEEDDSGASGAVRRGLADTLKSLRMSMGPRASMSSLTSVGNQAQLAALNSDPIEARMLKVQQDMLDKLERVANNTALRRGPSVGTDGDYRGSGGGADAGGDF